MDQRHEPGYSFLIHEAAALMGVSRRTVYYRIREGRLKKVRTLGGSTRVLVPSVAVLLQVGQRKNSLGVPRASRSSKSEP